MSQPNAPGPDRPLTLLVTAVGAIIGQGIVASLRRAGLAATIIGVDRNPDGIGRHFSDRFIAKPATDEDSPAYLDFWLDLVAQHKVDLVLPGLESDVLWFNRHRAALSAATRLALNDSRLIQDAQDKWNFGTLLSGHGLPAIPSCLPGSWQDCLDRLGPPPFILKPRRGNGSRGIVRLADETDYAYHLAKSGGDMMVQALVGHDDAEYTVGAYGLGDGTSLQPIIFRRRLSVAGNTQYAEVVRHEAIEDMVSRLSALFHPSGPTNYQFRMQAGTPYLLEINPRFSSSTSLRAAFGYNEAAMTVRDLVLGEKPVAPVVTPGRAWRYYEDLVVT